MLPYRLCALSSSQTFTPTWKPLTPYWPTPTPAAVSTRSGSWATWWDTARTRDRASPCCEASPTCPSLAITTHAVIGKLDPDLFNGAARAAALWTARQLPEDDLAFLVSMPETRVVGDFTHVHGSLRDPVMEYLISEPGALATFALMQTPFCLVGHSHYPLAWTETEHGADLALLDAAAPLALDPGHRVIVNPGSVGQPRDGDWRASYLLYDDQVGDAGTLEHRRVEYDVATTQRKIQAAGLPDSLADRLARGH